MSQVVKKSVSFSPSIAKGIERKAKQAHQSFSHLVNEAVKFFLLEEEEAEYHKAYAAYYQNPSNVKKDGEIVKDFSRLSSQSWPD